MDSELSASLNELNTYGMNKVHHIGATKRTPEIVFDPVKGHLKIKGVSMPENVDSFYAPILKYIDRYLENPPKHSVIVFDLEYINSSSSQMLLAILYKMKNIVGEGYSVQVEWHYLQDDDDIYDTGKTFSELTDLPFEFYEHN